MAGILTALFPLRIGWASALTASSVSSSLRADREMLLTASIATSRMGT
jgi:hypothetical protein